MGAKGNIAVTLENKRVALRALGTMAENNVDLVDATLAETARTGSEAVASLDRKDSHKLARTLEVIGRNLDPWMLGDTQVSILVSNLLLKIAARTWPITSERAIYNSRMWMARSGPGSQRPEQVLC